ncbi:MAG: hypothetical protein LC808_34415 [Actinobacteria bacterium]|nr:hypothetical protein [Actinomycetota bacterium]
MSLIGGHQAATVQRHVLWHDLLGSLVRYRGNRLLGMAWAKMLASDERAGSLVRWILSLASEALRARDEQREGLSCRGIRRL